MEEEKSGLDLAKGFLLRSCLLIYFSDLVLHWYNSGLIQKEE